MDIELEEELKAVTPLAILERTLRKVEDVLYQSRTDTLEENSRRIDELADAIGVAIGILIHERKSNQ